MGNKLFTTTINKQLFNQYKFGSDLSKQKVVAKIFNPYGEGRWFLLNSDPEDPDYLWAIVSMHGNVEIGSVSRRDLESIRLTPFRLPLERDIYFSPKNAEEVYQGLLSGKFYAKGGGFEEKTIVYGKYKNNNTDDSYLFSSESKGLDSLTNHKNIDVISVGQGKYDLFYGWDDDKQTDGVLYFGKWNNGVFGFNYSGKVKYAKGGDIHKPSRRFNHPKDLIGVVFEQKGKPFQIKGYGHSVQSRDFRKLEIIDLANPNLSLYFTPSDFAHTFLESSIGNEIEHFKNYKAEEYAKGGKIHSSDDMYSLNVYDENNTLVTTRRFRAKHMKEAQEIVEYEYEDDIKTKYGDDLRFRIVLANPDDQISEPNLMKRGGELKKKFDEGGKVGEPTEAPTPAYLMTLDEYLSSPIVPLMKEYDKFLKKNVDYLQSPEYYGYYYMPIEEAIELGEKTRFGTGERYSKTPEEHIRYNWCRAWERNTGNHNKFDYNEAQVFRKSETTPPSIVNENNNFRDAFLQYYSLKDLTRIEKDEKKSNKRAIKRALDNDIYTKLYGSGKLSLQRLKEITDSVGIKIPKRVLEANLEEKVDEDIKKSLSKLPKRSLDKLIELSNQLKEDLKPLQEEIFEREFKRYEEILPRYIGKTLTASEIGAVVPFYMNVYNVKNETKYETSPRTGYRTYITYSTILGLRDNYKVFLTEHLNQYVEALAYKIIFTIMDNFKNITLPIKSVDRIYIQVGYKGFEGAYKFTFENGSSFILKTQGIGAGGYNIQVYHFRYLSNIEAITLPDGTRTRDLSSFRG